MPKFIKMPTLFKIPRFFKLLTWSYLSNYQNRWKCPTKQNNKILLLLMMPIAPNTQHFKNHFLKIFQEKNSIMYKKSVNAGSQSDISRRGSSLADMNGNGHDSEVTEALNVNIVTNNCESTEHVGRHRGTCHSVNQWQGSAWSEWKTMSTQFKGGKIQN